MKIVKKILKVILFIIIGITIGFAIILVLALNDVGVSNETESVIETNNEVAVCTNYKIDCNSTLKNFNFENGYITTGLSLTISNIDEYEFITKDYYIKGEVTNNTDREFNNVKIEFNIYDKNGCLLGQASDYVSNLKSGVSWKFDVWVVYSDAYYYELECLKGY